MEKTLREQIEAFNNKGENFFYDGFCSNSAIYNKNIKLMGIAKKLAKTLAIDPDQTYVFFKNNCPLCGHLYDSISICDLDGNVLYGIGLNDERQNNRYEVYGRGNGVLPLFGSDQLKDIYAYFNQEIVEG